MKILDFILTATNMNYPEAWTAAFQTFFVNTAVFFYDIIEDVSICVCFF